MQCHFRINTDDNSAAAGHLSAVDATKLCDLAHQRASRIYILNAESGDWWRLVSSHRSQIIVPTVCSGYSNFRERCPETGDTRSCRMASSRQLAGPG